MTDPELPAELPPMTPEFEADIAAYASGRLDETELVERYMDRLGYGDTWRRQQRLEAGEAPE